MVYYGNTDIFRILRRVDEFLAFMVQKLGLCNRIYPARHMTVAVGGYYGSGLLYGV
jgi:hypothetical protein